VQASLPSRYPTQTSRLRPRQVAQIPERYSPVSQAAPQSTSIAMSSFAMPLNILRCSSLDLESVSTTCITVRTQCPLACRFLSRRRWAFLEPGGAGYKRVSCYETDIAVRDSTVPNARLSTSCAMWTPSRSSIIHFNLIQGSTRPQSMKPKDVVKGVVREADNLI
jgi:hypothetical protein